MRVSYVRTLASGAELLRFDQPMGLGDAGRWRRQCRVWKEHYAAPNRTIRPQAVPTDPGFSVAMGLSVRAGIGRGANFVSAWDITRGAPVKTIGVIDAGISGSNEGDCGTVAAGSAVPERWL